MKSLNNKEIIYHFFESKLSKKVQLLFRYWFQLKSDEDDKEKVMEDIWDNCPSEITQNTWEDLAKLQLRISSQKQSPKYLKFNVLIKYAAIVAVAFLSSVSIYYFSANNALNQPTEFVEFFVPYGKCQKILLADGSTVWLNAGSVLIYPKEFTANTRSVYLSGEANFDVAKNPNQPFIVKTNHLNVEALGTVFSVKSYPGSAFTIATLEEGSIQVDVDDKLNTSSVLKPNEQLSYSHNTGEISIDKVDAAKLSSWKEGYLLFRDAKFEDIVSTLERKYNVDINYDSQKFNTQSYYVRFNPNESLDEALKVLSQITGNFKYTIHNSTVNIN